MRIDVTELRKAPGETRHYEFQEEIPPLEIDVGQAVFAEPAAVRLAITNIGVSLLVKGEISGELQLVCGRCLDTYKHHVLTAFAEQYRHVSEADDGDDEHRNYHIYEDNKIDFADVVRDNIILDLPMKPVCSNDCRGICPICGHNKNISACDCKEEDIDPRLAALKDYLKS